MSVHYKFKSALEFSTLPVDGVNISVEDLKEAIIQQKKLSKAQPFDLIITNAETNKEYSDEKTLIPKNSSLLIARVPIDPSQLKKPWNNHVKEPTALLLSNPANLMNTEDASEAAKLGRLAMQVTDLTKMTGSEDDVIHAMMAQSTLDYHPSRYVKLRNSRMSGKVPAVYTCYKCSKGGHWVSNCPLSNQDLRKSYGIPSDQLMRVSDPNTPGVMVTTRGTLVVYRNAPVADLPAPPGEDEPRLPLPEDLQCPLCEDLMKDAVLVPCCAFPFCDDCIRNQLIESDDSQCPKCTETNVSIGNLIPTRFLRKKCFEFDKATKGNYIRSYEKLYVSPPASVAPLPPHLRTATSARPTPSSSPLNKDAAEVSSTTNITSDSTSKEVSSKPASPENREAATNKSDSDKENSSDKVPLASSNVIASAADTTGPSSSPVQGGSTANQKAENGESRPLYRGLLKDVEESEREALSKVASPVQTEVEKTKKVKKKKEKKKKDSSKEKKKDKHRHGNKSLKSPRTESDTRPPGTESPLSVPLVGSGTDYSKSPISRGTKRDRSSDSASSCSPSHDKRKCDNTSDLFNFALNIPINATNDSQGPYSEPFYPPVQPIFSVPPPGYPPTSMYIPPPITETIDDPLEAFNKHLREQDERKRREQMRRYRSPSFSRPHPRNRSWSRSRSRSPSRRQRSRSPRSRRFKWSRSRSPISPRHHSQNSRHQVTPPSHRGHSPPSHRQYSPPSHRQYTSPPLPHRQYSPSGRRIVSPLPHPSPSHHHHNHHYYDRIRSHSKSRSPHSRHRGQYFSPSRDHLPAHTRLLAPPPHSPSVGYAAHSSPARSFRAGHDESRGEGFPYSARDRSNSVARREGRPSAKDRLGPEGSDLRRHDRGPRSDEEATHLLGTGALITALGSRNQSSPSSPPGSQRRSSPHHTPSRNRQQPSSGRRSRSLELRSGGGKHHRSQSPSRDPHDRKGTDKEFAADKYSRSGGRSRYEEDRERRHAASRDVKRFYDDKTSDRSKDDRSPRTKDDEENKRNGGSRRDVENRDRRRRSVERRLEKHNTSKDNIKEEDISKNRSNSKDKSRRSLDRSDRDDGKTKNRDGEKRESERGVKRDREEEKKSHDRSTKDHERKSTRDGVPRPDDRRDGKDDGKRDSKSDANVEKGTSHTESSVTESTSAKQDKDKPEDEKKSKSSKEKSEKSSDKEKKKRDKKKKKKEKKERRNSQQSEGSQHGASTEDEPKRKKKKHDKKEKSESASMTRPTTELNEIQISSVGNGHTDAASPQQSSTSQATLFSPSLLPELSKWERDDDSMENSSFEVQDPSAVINKSVVTDDVLRKAESALFNSRGILGRVLLPRKMADLEKARELETQRMKDEPDFTVDRPDNREAKRKGPSIQITISSKNECDIGRKRFSNILNEDSLEPIESDKDTVVGNVDQPSVPHPADQAQPGRPEDSTDHSTELCTESDSVPSSDKSINDDANEEATSIKESVPIENETKSLLAETSPIASLSTLLYDDKKTAVEGFTTEEKVFKDALDGSSFELKVTSSVKSSNDEIESKVAVEDKCLEQEVLPTAMPPDIIEPNEPCTSLSEPLIDSSTAPESTFEESREECEESDKNSKNCEEELLQTPVESLIKSSQQLLQLGSSVLKDLNQVPLVKPSSTLQTVSSNLTSVATVAVHQSTSSNVSVDEDYPSSRDSCRSPRYTQASSLPALSSASTETSHVTTQKIQVVDYLYSAQSSVAMLPELPARVIPDSRTLAAALTDTSAFDQQDADKKKKRKKRKRSVSSSSSSSSSSTSSDSESESSDDEKRKKRKKNKKKSKKVRNTDDDSDGKDKKKKKKKDKKKKKKKDKKKKKAKE